ncbi:MAG TPA: diguanylate cyclase [Telmatospirillum sp.]|nr:diguanylate cyclase [Telmatospirillum sp.]
MALLSLLVTLGVWRQSRDSAAEKAHALFDLRVEDLAHAVVLRMADYEQILRGARGLFAADHSVSARDWHRYVEELNIGSLYLGLESLSMLRVVAAADVARFAAESKRDPDIAKFSPQITAPREQDYVFLSFIEPVVLRTSRIVGRDFGTDPVLAAALARARDSGQPAATAPTRSFNFPDDRSPCLSIFIPIFRSGQALNSVTERRRALWAYVGSAIRIETMIGGVIQNEISPDIVEHMAFAISDVTDPGQTLPLYDSGLTKANRQPDAFVKKMAITVTGRQWMVEAVSLPIQRAGEMPGIWTGAVALFGVLLTGLTYALGLILENRANLRRAYAQLAEREAELDRLAHSDPLTGAANRRHFFVVGASEWTRAKRHGRALSVLMIDVDHFKAVNDTHGHGVGDETLKSLTVALRSALRDCDLMARVGGEEFAVLLAEIDLAAAQVVAERLRLKAAELVVPNGNGGHLSVTISIGAASLCSDDLSLDDVVRRADRSLYVAKTGGRNQVIVSEQEELPLLALAGLSGVEG